MGLILAATIVASGAHDSNAGFNAWTAETQSDPFSGGTKVTVDFSSSLRSGVVIVCDSSQVGLMVRAVPGFAYSVALNDIKPLMEFAVDGNRLLGEFGVTGSVGNNLAVAQVQLKQEGALKFVRAFTKAKNQVAIKDGISDRPFLLRTSGSLKAGAALGKCLDKQVSAKPRESASSLTKEADLLTPTGRFVRFKGIALAAQEKCPEFSLKQDALKPDGLNVAEVEKVEKTILDGTVAEARDKLKSKSCFAAIREPLEFTKLTLDDVWQKK